MSKRPGGYHILDSNGDLRRNKVQIRVDINTKFIWQNPPADDVEKAFRKRKEELAKRVCEEYMPVVLAAINHRLKGDRGTQTIGDHTQ
jgi:hypothetical protein